MLERIPVVEVDGEVVSELLLDAGRASGEARYCGRDEPEIDEQEAADGLIVDGERLSLGVAARLSRYLQVLTQARKMGRETISSQELSEYTHINPTQIRRDLSGFGKFGKRGVGYNVDSLVARDPQDPAHLGPAQHRPLRRRQPRPGDRQLRHLRRPRLPDRRDVRRRPEVVGIEVGGLRGPRLRRARGGRRRAGDRRRRPRGARRRRPGASPTASSRPA